MTLAISDDLKPPRSWLRIGVVFVLALIVAGVLAMAGCGNEAPARTWPEVIDRHWFAAGCLIAWTVFWLAVVVGGIKVKLRQPDKGAAS
jgi:uncharacterized membrane protein